MNTLELLEPEAPPAPAQAVNTQEGENVNYILHLPLGLLGFCGVTHYALHTNPKAGLMWLQMLEGAKYSFRVVLASLALPDYRPEISDQDAEYLELTDPADAIVLNIVTLGGGRATVNLKGPVVINRRSLIGKQVILKNAARFDDRHPLNAPVKEKPEEKRIRPAAKTAQEAKAALLAERARQLRKFPESKLAHKYLDSLKGLEIGGSAHNPFGLQTRNVDYCADPATVFKLEEIRICGEALKVDVVAPGDELPLPDDSEDFVISSPVIEHFFDPIKAIKEWLRVVRPGGHVFIIAPHKERTFDKNRPRTSLQELLDRHSGWIPRPAVDSHAHYSVWITEDLLELCRHLQWNVVEFHDADDKVGNGFTVIIRKGRKTQ
jgi:flagellar assembly factor FliW/SAM-dependent methyltransferase